jgi:16S rRNA processing protein RimM
VATEETPGVTVARILRPHGLRGEVAAEILTDFPERFSEMASVELWSARSGSRVAALRGCRLTTSRGGQALLHFEGSNSIEDAQKLVGFEIRIPLSERMPLPDASYYVGDLVGCEVYERGETAPGSLSGSLLGTVSDVQFTGGPPILAVDTASGEVLIPLAQEICVSVDISARRIEVVLPEGLRDINRK